jgi:hypothetical protein
VTKPSAPAPKAKTKGVAVEASGWRAFNPVSIANISASGNRVYLGCPDVSA